MSDVTRILRSIDGGDAKAAQELLPLVYGELRRLAAHKMANEAAGNTLQPTALVHEAWLRLIGNEKVEWQGRAHFFGAAAEAMRRILIDSARRKQAARHGGGWQRMSADELELPALENNADELIAVNDALEKFAAHDPARAKLVELRYFGGLTLDEVAEVLGISKATAKRQWTYARAWLFREIRGS